MKRKKKDSWMGQQYGIKVFRPFLREEENRLYNMCTAVDSARFGMVRALRVRAVLCLHPTCVSKRVTLTIGYYST